jgi:holo-ACP synthase
MILDDGEPQVLADILSNREWRERLQNGLMARFPDGCLVAVKLNIPGVIKNNACLQDMFRVGLNELVRRLDLDQLHADECHYYVDRPTGPEAFLAFARDDWAKVKRVSIGFEDDFVLGRLFDADVMRQGSERQLSRTDLGMAARRCMVCGKPAKECARDQTHSAEELGRAIDRWYDEYRSLAQGM